MPEVGVALRSRLQKGSNYKVGIACTLNTGGIIETTKFWETTTTVAAQAGAGPQNFIWGNPAAPAAPAIGAVGTAETTATVPFTASLAQRANFRTN